MAVEQAIIHGAGRMAVEAREKMAEEEAKVRALTIFSPGAIIPVTPRKPEESKIKPLVYKSALRRDP